MSGERLAELAVDAVTDWLDAQLQTYLTAVETARGYTAGDLTAPVDIIKADLPEYGGGTPLIMVFEESGVRDFSSGITQKHWVFDVSVILVYGCDAGIEAGRVFLRDYVTALVDCLDSTTTGRTLNSRVGSSLLTGVSFTSFTGSNARHLVHAALDLKISIFDT